MTSRPPTTSLEPLLDESAWLGRLARHLVSDHGAAEDVAQETWLAQLTRRDGQGKEPASRGWLAQVARRIAGKGLRGRRRRGDREALAATPEKPTSDPSQVVEHLELAQILAEELAKLDEPFRTTLYQRYFEGQSASAIAEREGIPAGTVRWRAARGRELLKVALQERDGETWSTWVQALAPLALVPGIPAGSSVTVSSSLGAIMSLQWTLAGALAGALAAGGIWFVEKPIDIAADRGSPLESASHELEGLAAPAAPSLAVQNPAGAVRSVPAKPLDPLFGVILSGTVVDTDQVPVSGVRVILADEELNYHKMNTGAQGRWSMLGLVPGTYQVSLNAQGFMAQEFEFELPAEPHFKLNLELTPGVLIPVRVEDPNGRRISLGQRAPIGQFLGVVITRSKPPESLPAQAYPRSLGGSLGTLQDVGPGSHVVGARETDSGLLTLRAAPPMWVSLTYRHRVLESRWINGSEAELVFVVNPEDLEAYKGDLRLQVVDQSTGVSLSEGPELTLITGGAPLRPQVDGSELVFRDVPAGGYDLALRLSDYEHMELGVVVEAGVETNLGVLRVGKKRPFDLHLASASASGEPLALRVHAVRLDLVNGPGDLSQRVIQESDAQGNLRVWRLAPGVTHVAAGGQDGWAWAARVVDTSTQAKVDLVLRRGTEVVFDTRNLSTFGGPWVLEDASGTVLFGRPHLPVPTWLEPGDYRLRDLSSSTGTSFTVGSSRQVVQVNGGSAK